MQIKEYHELTEIQKRKVVAKLAKEIGMFYRSIDEYIPPSLVDNEISLSIKNYIFLINGSDVFMIHIYNNRL